jgi:Phosphoenolpyruvate phosphomutase
MALHTREGGLVMPNAWDGLSALMLADAGFEAIATSSVALAATLGRVDGRHDITRDEHLDHARRLGRLSRLPINGDFEDGYGDAPRTSPRPSNAPSSTSWPVSGSKTRRGIPINRSVTSTMRSTACAVPSPRRSGAGPTVGSPTRRSMTGGRQ